MWTDDTINKVIKNDSEWESKTKKMHELGAEFRKEVDQYKATIEEILDFSFIKRDWEIDREILKSYLYRAHKIKVNTLNDTVEGGCHKRYFDLGRVMQDEIHVSLEAVVTNDKFCEVVVRGVAALNLEKVGYCWKKENKDFSVINYAYVIEDAADILKFHFLEGFFGHRSQIPSLKTSLSFDKA